MLVGVTGLTSKNARVADESKDLVDKTLQEIAPALFRGMSIATVEHTKVTHVMQQLGLKEDDLPFIYVTDSNK